MIVLGVGNNGGYHVGRKDVPAFTLIELWRSDFTNFNITAQNWNRDHEAHPEYW